MNDTKQPLLLITTNDLKSLVGSVDTIETLPYFSISPSGGTIFNQPITKRIKHKGEPSILENAMDDDLIKIQAEEQKKLLHDRFKNNGVISHHSVKRIRNAIGWMYHLAQPKRILHRPTHSFIKFRLTFITLTLPSKQVHSDTVIKHKLLDSFLTEMRKRYGLKIYMWRAEKQSNGNIHFHILTNKYFEHSELRRTWNRICNTLGYVDSYKEEMIKDVKCFSDYYNKFIDQGSYMQLMKRYNYGVASKWESPNSTDIHSIHKLRNIVAYLVKYMSKEIKDFDSMTDEQKKLITIEGRIWGLSTSLSRMRNVVVLMDSKVSTDVSKIYSSLQSYEFSDEFFSYKSFTFKDLARLGCTELLFYITTQMAEVFGTNELRFL